MSGEEYFLSARHLVGRAATCQLRINDPAISGFHAELFWDGERWNVQDLGSRNGTALGGQSLAKGEQRPLSPGAEIILGGHVRLRLVDDSPPHLIATSSDGDVRVAEDELLVLPSNDEPELTLYRDLDGQWLVESAVETRPLPEGATLVAGGKAWRILSPRSVPMTREIGSGGLLAEHLLRFHVSRDGEHVELSVVRGSAVERLEPRVHQFLLLALARERLRDAQNPALPVSEQGWVYRDELARRLDVQASLIHLWNHRARKQLARAGILDAASIIERRMGAAQLRIGASRLEVEDR